MYELKQVCIHLDTVQSILSDEPIDNVLDAVQLLQQYLYNADREFICVLNLRSDFIPINFNVVAMGSVTHVGTEIREIFKSAILSNAVFIVVLHNHLGKAIPSSKDIKFTKKIAKAGKQLGIGLLDHVIVTRDDVYSMKDNNMF